jgi:hypothetical protein
VLRREWYVAKDQTIKDRPLRFTKNSVPVGKPVQEIQKLLNPFLLDQDYLRNMTETDRRKFFVEFFGVDTSELDKENLRLVEDARMLRAKIAGYGEIDLMPVETIDVTKVREQLTEVRSDWTKQCQVTDAANVAVMEHNNNRLRGKGKADAMVVERDQWIEQVRELEKKIADSNVKILEIENWLEKHPAKETTSRPEAPDTSALEKQIEEAAAQNVRAENYKKAKERDAQRSKDQLALVAIETRQRDIKKAKTAKLAEIAVNSKVKGLQFDEEGSFTFEGTSAGMVSDSQLQRLSSEVAALFPAGLGLELLDRGESLGRAIFQYVKHAEEHSTTVLATIVGEKPADVPEKIGVFVVKDGVVMKD